MPDQTTPQPGKPTVASVLTDVTKILVTANTALPIVVSLVDAIALMIKGATDRGPSIAERAEIIRGQVAENKAYLDADIARLDAVIAGHK